MFNRLFGTNTNFDTNSCTNITEDAMAIRRTVDYVILRAAWDEYVNIKKQDEDYLYGDATATPAWEALKKVEEYGGDLSLFTKKEQHLLRALRKGFMIYADVMRVFIDHHDNQATAESLLAQYPDLQNCLPEEYRNIDKVIEVIIEVIRDYQWQLEQFSKKYREDLLENITRKGDPSLEFRL